MSESSRKQRRAEAFNITFVDGLIEGWVFGVHESFRDRLDILYLEYVDKDRSKELRKVRSVSDDGKPTKVMRSAWSRGVPPLLRFDVGHVFYDPPPAKHMAWGDAIKVLKQVVQVVEAKPDDQPGKGGWVKIILYQHRDGVIAKTDWHTMSQAESEAFLRFGHLFGAPVPTSVHDGVEARA